MFNTLYTLIISPLKLLFEWIFYSAYAASSSAGLSIVAVSLILNLLLLPLYNKAEKLQEEENEIQKKLKPGISKIKKAFKSDEQYFILQTYYRQNNYKPIYSLRSLTSLLLEIPFFIAAYSFLTNVQILKGQSFLFIKDLSLPDGLLFGVNILPILMTLINLVSVIIYTKGTPLKSRIQLYLMAFIFLVLLYDSPSGLALYYLLNNLFSLIKNVITKSEYKLKIISVLFIIAGILALLFAITSPSLANHRKLILVIMMLGLLLIGIGIYALIKNGFPSIILNDIENNNKNFLLCSFFLCVLIGLFIPSQVIATSPGEFVDLNELINPLKYLFNTFLLAVGLFVVWFNVYYSLMNDDVRKIISCIVFGTCLVALINHLFFRTDMGFISNFLVYDVFPVITTKDVLINLIVDSVILVTAVLIWFKKNEFIRMATIIACISIFVISLFNMQKISETYNGVVDTEKNSNNNESKPIDPYLTLSKNGKNVIVFMLDRAISAYYPYILKENSVLQKQFDGFTYYPNTITLGMGTNVGTPGLFGGYEYSPEEINKRSDELLKDKQNEALKVMPVLFDKNDFNVVVFDPPLANYSWIPDVSIYDDYPNIHAYVTEGRYSSNSLKSLNRNLFCYSISRTVPTALFYTIYDSGNYLEVKQEKEYSKEIHHFLQYYDPLCKLIERTEFNDDEIGSFLMMQSSATHEPTELQLPDYSVEHEIDNSNYHEKNTHKKSIYGEELILSSNEEITHYHVDIATLSKIGEWFDYLRENSVYDNTRIIIVSDHGISSVTVYGSEFIDSGNALLLYKDFNSTGLNIDYSFMTNADTPYLATKDVIDKPENVFTGNAIQETKKEGINFHVFSTTDWDITYNNSTQFPIQKIYSVHDDCLNVDNWDIIIDNR